MKVLLLLLLLAIASKAAAETSGEVHVGHYLREATLQGLLRPSKNITSFRGKPLIINVWASWCGPCRDEMASIQHLYQQYGGKKFNIIGISTDDDIYAATQLLKEEKLTFNNYIDHNLQLENMLGANTIPLTIFVDANGRVLKKVRGSQKWDSLESVKLISQTFNTKIP